MRVLSSLATRDSSLIKPAGKLKLWGVGLFEDGPLGLDQLLANEKVTYAPMRDCIMQFLVTILAYGEQLCKDLSAGDDNIQTLKEEIVIIFELEELLDMVVEGRQDAAEGTHDTSEIASSVKRLFALSPSIRRARQLQSLQLHEIAGACVNENQTFTGYTTNFTSTESPVEILYHRLEAVAEIIRKYDKAAATKATDAKIYLPAFDKQRKQLGEFYEVWCTRSSLHSIEKSVMKARKEEARLTNALADFISHSGAGPQPDEISAIINLVSETGTKLLNEDTLQQLQLCGTIITTQATRKSNPLQAVKQSKHSSHKDKNSSYEDTHSSCENEYCSYKTTQ